MLCFCFYACFLMVSWLDVMRWCLRWHMWDLSTENSSRMYRSRRWYVTFFLSILRKELGQTTESPKDTVKKTQLLWQPFLFKAILETIDNILENTNLWCLVFGWIRCGKGVALSQAGHSRWPALGMVCDGKFRSTTFGVGSFTRTLEAAPGMFWSGESGIPCFLGIYGMKFNIFSENWWVGSDDSFPNL